VHLVGFIIRIYHDARSPECQKLKSSAQVNSFCDTKFEVLIAVLMNV